MKRLKKCPSCGKSIYQYAQVCPYCKGETHFTSLDEVLPPEMPVDSPAKTPSGSSSEPSVEPAADEPSQDSTAHHGRIGEYVRHLKEDTEKVKHEYDEKIKSRFSTSTILIGSVIGILSIIVLGFFIAVQMMEQKTFSLNTTVDNSLKEVIDSMETELYQSSTIVAKFPDRQHHCLVYLREGRLHIYDAAAQEDHEVDLQSINSKALVDYGGSGVLNAYLSTNEKYILIIASRNAGNTEFGFYRLSTEPENPSLEVLDRGRVVVDKDGYKVSSDSRTAVYDANGDRVSGLNSDDWEKVAPKVEKTKRTTESTEKKVERAPTQEKVTEQLKPSIDLAPKPVAPPVPEKITIKPVDTSGN